MLMLFIFTVLEVRTKPLLKLNHISRTSLKQQSCRLTLSTKAIVEQTFITRREKRTHKLVPSTLFWARTTQVTFEEVETHKKMITLMCCWFCSEK